MYSVSQDFLTAAKRPIQTHRVVGTIGSVSFDDSNIVQGTFNITNQCSDTSDVTLGSVYTGTLTATFHGVSIDRYAWINKVITPYFGMQLANLTWEEIPLGVFTVKEARHTANGVEITAYDNMIKLDRKFKKSKFKDTGKMFDHISTICTACGIYLANTEAEIQAMPNGNTECGIVGTKSNASLKKRSNDIETYRDLVYWIAQTMACFATMDRNGMLKFVRYQDENATVDTIAETHQLVGASFNDYVTRYTGIYVTNSVDDEELYYGYDLDALNTELTTATTTLSTITSDLADLEESYEQGQITEEEYLAQKKTLNKQKRNIEKRITWLNKAIANVTDGEEDGAYLELGCNPILQPDGVGASYITMRTNVLEALDVISYTPFTCDTVCGVHYDLGDVLQFTGGHAGDGECCCLMAYDWTLHGAYSMQGFGQDPALQAVKSKTAKSASKASKSSNEANRTYTGSSAPTEGNDGDVYIATSGENIDGISTTDSHAVYSNVSFTQNENGSYNIVTGGTGTSSFEYVDYEISGLVPGDSYTFSCTGQWVSSGILRFYSGYHAGFCFNTEPHGSYPTDSSIGAWDSSQRYQSFYRNGSVHSYTGTFTATAETMYLTTLYAAVYDGVYTTQYINDFTLVPANGNSVNSVKVKQGDAWVNIDYAKEVSQVSTSGEKIAEVSNSDGTVTDVYAPYMSGATPTVAGSSGLVPAPASGDEEKYLRGDGTWGVISGGGASALSELADVELTDLADGEILKYDVTEEKWVNAEDGGSGGGSVVALPSLYSTKEKKVGLWTDGKPLYQKTFDLGSDIAVSNTSWYASIVSVSSIEKIAVAWGMYSGGTYYPLMAYHTDDNVNVLAARANASATIRYLTLQYTKTTDTPVEDFNLQDFGIFAPVIYSLEEREIGVWTDGKPLYQKTIIISSVDSSGSGQSVGSVLGFVPDAVPKIFGTVDRNLASYGIVGCITYDINSEETTNTMYTFVRYDKYNDTLYYKIKAADNTAENLIVTLQYTKTTDVAGSGSYAELGVPAVHYDSTERVIGTWFGKPLYQKTIYSTSQVTLVDTEWRTIPWVNAPSNVENLIHAKFAGIVPYSNAFYRFYADSGVIKGAAYVTYAFPPTQAPVYVTIQYTKTTD